MKIRAGFIIKSEETTNNTLIQKCFYPQKKHSLQDQSK